MRWKKIYFKILKASKIIFYHGRCKKDIDVEVERVVWCTGFKHDHTTYKASSAGARQWQTWSRREGQTWCQPEIMNMKPLAITIETIYLFVDIFRDPHIDEIQLSSFLWVRKWKVAHLKSKSLDFCDVPMSGKESTVNFSRPSLEISSKMCQQTKAILKGKAGAWGGGSMAKTGARHVCKLGVFKWSIFYIRWSDLPLFLSF